MTTAVRTADDEAWDVMKAMLSDEGKRAPWPFFRRFHDLGELFETPDGSFVIVGYDAVAEALRSPVFGKGNGAVERPPFSTNSEAQDRELADIWSDAVTNIVMLDPPHHTRIRNIVQSHFTPRYVKRVEAAVPRVIGELLDEIDSSRPIDIIADFSARFAPEIMAELIGLPSNRREEVSGLTSALLKSADPGSPFELQREGALASRKHREYIRDVVEERKVAPRDDFVGAIIATEELEERERTTLLQTLYQGGYETTAHMIGNGLVALLQNPEQFEALVADRGLLKPAIEEMLRFDSAISLSRMITLEDAELCGRTIPKGRYVTALMAAANRDPDMFADPDRFDIRRKGKPHLSFAGGVHYCLGVNLARFELEHAFAALIDRYPRMRLAEAHPPRSRTFHQQSFQRVMVQLEP